MKTHKLLTSHKIILFLLILLQSERNSIVVRAEYLEKDLGTRIPDQVNYA